jgi:spermidine synthase
MRARRPRLLSIESPFPEAHSMLRVLEPAGSAPGTIWERVFDGSYDKPFIVDSALTRCLHFDLDAVQSAMDLEHPERLCLAYTRKMMAFLLFKRTPARILLLGLGGGSIAKFCYRQLQSSALTAVEMNADVISLREEFRIPADDERFRVICADGAAYVSKLSRCKDVILADACDRSGVAPQLDTLEFYRNARRSLVRDGVLVANLCGDPHGRNAHLLMIRQVFGDDVLTLPVRSDGNLIVFAFRGGCPAVRLANFASDALELKHSLGLDFPHYIRRLARDWQRRIGCAAQG